ncbi:MAG: DNA-processing protein DprA [Proteobacteria bacterium]|nr:DNA-processing protein DprA [Pseudomonadota bacterium]
MKVSRAAAAAQAVEGRRRGRNALGAEWRAAGGLDRWLDRQDRELFAGIGYGPDVRAVGFDDHEFGDRLRAVEPACAALFVRGVAEALPPPDRCVAIIGARRCTDEGRWMARDLARAAVEAGAVVVSGLALGIDAAAHTGAMDAGGRTLAVLASPVDRPSPQRNRRIADRIVSGGGWLVSERPPGASVRGYDFPVRNRIVAAVSGLIVVVEAGFKSGTLSTVEHALRMDIPTGAVPGWPTRPMSKGPNALIAAGASLIASGDDLLAAMFESRPPPPAIDLDADEQAVLEGTRLGVAPIERWIANSGLPADRGHVALVRLAGKGVLRRLAAGRMGRVF